jgi:hypothetical protein
MKLVKSPIPKNELKEMSISFGGLVKAVVDVKKEVMVVDAPMHADEEKELLDMGSDQDDLWGINLYPDLPHDDFIEFDSMINLRPRLNNMSRGIDNKELQTKIISIVLKLVK